MMSRIVGCKVAQPMPKKTIKSAKVRERAASDSSNGSPTKAHNNARMGSAVSAMEADLQSQSSATVGI